MSQPIVEGFSISHAAILDGTTGAEKAPIYGVREGTITVNEGNYDNTGDDAILSSWFWLNNADVVVKSGFVTFAVLAARQGDAITSSGSGATQLFSIPLWTQRSLNVAPAPMLLRMPSKDSLGAARTLDVVLYKVTFRPLAMEGLAYKTGLVVSYSGRALSSAVDETGASLGTAADNAYGRLISHA